MPPLTLAGVVVEKSSVAAGANRSFSRQAGGDGLQHAYVQMSTAQ